MKRKFFVLTALSALCIGTVAHAEVGDIAGTIYTTDILTQVDGRDITSYSMDGRTLIALEDLADYGFNVYYNDNIRSVFVTRTGEPDPDFKPTVKRGKVGGTAGYYYETDITAYLNGSWIQAYAIDGKMVACVEDMGDTTSYTQFGDNRFQMGYAYDDSKRLLSLNTNPADYGGGYNTLVKNVLDGSSYYWTPNRLNCLHTDDVFFAPYSLGGLPHGGTARYYTIVYKNGLCYDAQGIAGLYWLNISDPVLSEDGKILYFINYEDDKTEYKMIELDSLHVAPAQRSAYETAATMRENDFTASFNGKEIPLYNIGGGDYINPDDIPSEEIQILKGSAYAVTEYISGEEVKLIPLSMLTYEDVDLSLTNYKGITYRYDIDKKTVIFDLWEKK